MFGHYTYLILMLSWALPVLALQWAVGLSELWRARRRWALATGLPTLYLCVADRLALGNGIWTIHEDRSTGILIAGLPLEEALFFFFTNLMVVQALILFQSPVTRARIARWLTRARVLRPAAGAAH
jgi:lycopene beta-cyclase